MPDIAPLPYRKQLRDTIRATTALHPGLVYERFFPCWKDDGFDLHKPLGQVLDVFCSQFGRTGRDPSFAGLLAARHERLAGLVRARHGLELSATSLSPLASGLGIDHPTENGFVFDHGCGVPYLPGSTIKGLCRAWAVICDRERHVEELLGPASVEEGSGRVIFLPAYPAAWPELISDVICNHHRDYYGADPGKRRYIRNEFPTCMDIESPVPITHLAVAAGTEFLFRILPLARETATDDLARTGALLAEALRELGIGARTAVGYGVMEVEDNSQLAETWEKPIMSGIIRTFVSYSHEDADRVRGFLARGALLGISPWLDSQNMLPHAGHSLDATIQEALQRDNIAAITLFLSEHSGRSEWVEKEMQWGREMGKHVIPVLDSEDREVTSRLADLVRPHEPHYLRLGDRGALFALLNTLVAEAGADVAGEVVIYLGHRDDRVAPSGLPEQWRDVPIIELRTAEHRLRDVLDWDFKGWLPADEEEYRRYEQGIQQLARTLPRVERIRVAGFAPLGIAGLVGKYWDRGSSVRRLSVWNTFAKEEWSIEKLLPEEGGPEEWRHLEFQESGDGELGAGSDILVGHFTQENQFASVRNWVRGHGDELGVGRAVWFRSPTKIDAAMAPQLALEIVQSFGWARQKYGAATVYWATGVPMALMPLVTYLARARGRIVFLDYHLGAGKYIPAFEVF